jgi:hypothetical protein
MTFSNMLTIIAPRLFLLLLSLFILPQCNGNEEQGVVDGSEDNLDPKVKEINGEAYTLLLRDDFNDFNKDHWSKGMINE